MAFAETTPLGNGVNHELTIAPKMKYAPTMENAMTTKRAVFLARTRIA